jgi:hypothetical protein
MPHTVILNIYDLSQVNNALYKYGVGVYHTGKKYLSNRFPGVEVNGVEYSFGGNPNLTTSGIFECVPMQADGAIFRESRNMGSVKDMNKVMAALGALSMEFKANEYDILGKNCNHFSEAICMRLVGKRLPSFVNR